MKTMLLDKSFTLEEFVKEIDLPVVKILRGMVGHALEADDKVRFTCFSDDDGLQVNFIQIYLFVISSFVVSPLEGYSWNVLPCEDNCLKLTIYC